MLSFESISPSKRGELLHVLLARPDVQAPEGRAVGRAADLVAERREDSRVDAVGLLLETWGVVLVVAVAVLGERALDRALRVAVAVTNLASEPAQHPVDLSFI